MTDEKNLAILDIADTHLKHLNDAINDISRSYPFNENFVINMTKDQLRILDTLTGRFGKLQDLIGSKIIDIYLFLASESMPGKSAIDKINKLEKLYIIENADLWMKLRDVRNHITHEYPDKPQLVAKHLNDIFVLAPKLIAIYEKLAMEIRRLAA